MVGTEDILFPGMQQFSVFHFEGKADQDEQKFGPPPVEFANEFEFSSENNWNQKQKEKNHKEYKEDNNAVKRIKPPDEFHAFLLIEGHLYRPHEW